MAFLSLANGTFPMGSGQFLTLERLLTILPQGPPGTRSQDSDERGNTSHTNYPGALPGTEGVQGENKRKT